MAEQYQAPKTSLPQYDFLKKQARQRAQAGAQQQGDAMQRRFAALGNLNSGAALKAQQNVQEAAARQEEEALGQIQGQELAEMSQRDEAQKGRDIQQEQFGKQFGLQRDVFGEQQRQARFGEGIAQGEFNLSKMNTAINTAQALKEAGGLSNLQQSFSNLSQMGFDTGIDPTLLSAMQRRNAFAEGAIGAKGVSTLSKMGQPKKKGFFGKIGGIFGGGGSSQTAIDRAAAKKRKQAGL